MEIVNPVTITIGIEDAIKEIELYEALLSCEVVGVLHYNFMDVSDVSNVYDYVFDITFNSVEDMVLFKLQWL